MVNKNEIVARVNDTFSPTNVIESFLLLFRVIPTSFVSERSRLEAPDVLSRGLVFIDKKNNFFLNVRKEAFAVADRLYGAKAVQFNQTFYDSFDRVFKLTYEQRAIDQIAHYFSTYGTNNTMPTYLPTRSILPPEVDYNISQEKLAVIRVLPFEDCVEMLDNYLRTTAAPKNVEYVKPLLYFSNLAAEDIKSLELRCLKYEEEDIVPSSPKENLRYIVYRTTGQTLLIKSRELIYVIKETAPFKGELAYKLFQQSDLTSLASIFFAHKPIFLAFKAHDKCAPIINRIRRLADKYHAPNTAITVKDFAAVAAKGFDDTYDSLLSKASNTELIKILNYYNLNPNDAKVYHIRDGKTFVKRGSNPPKNAFLSQHKVLNELTERLMCAVRHRTFYIPKGIEYAAPISEKQTIGNIPFGSFIEVPHNEAFSIGIHWFNQPSQVDLDLHMTNQSIHFGWNGLYSTKEDVAYSGDMTDAPTPHGAAEAFYVKPTKNFYLLNVHRFRSPKKDVDFSFFAAKTNSIDGATYDPNQSLFTPIPLKFTTASSHMQLGIFHNNRFYFCGSLSNMPKEHLEDYINGLWDNLTSRLTISQLLQLCGATVIRTEEEIKDYDDVISLSPHDLTATTLFNIVQGILPPRY